MKPIDTMEYNDIPEISRLINKMEHFANDGDMTKKLLENHIDPAILNELSPNVVIKLGTITRNALETKIRQLIKSETGQEPLPIGTQIILKHDTGEYKAGSIVFVTGTKRFDEDTFEQGWYAYESGSIMLYRNEFDIKKG